ncbi:hypothetical protein F885_01310 [Acinetobacter higginsii]|nr:hypothetical protein F885_01310 [Acinetobacter higginsii]
MNMLLMTIMKSGLNNSFSTNDLERIRLFVVQF